MGLGRMAINTGYIKKANLLFNSKLEVAISIIITKNLAVKRDEKILIVYDSGKAELAKKFKKVSSELVDSIDMLRIPMLNVNAEEPKKEIANKFIGYDALIFLTTKSLSHTKARRDATENGARIASMPGVTESILKRSIDVDYIRLKNDILKVGKLLDKAKDVKINTLFGTDIKFSIAGRKAHGLMAGIYNKRGAWGNLPEGEVYIAPVEGSAEGHFVVDGSVAGFGRMVHPVIFFVENGYVKRITDGKRPFEIEKVLDKIGRNARNIAEFGIGFNRKAKITGVVLEDEKAYGTCHLALGNNIGFGGNVDVALHIDCVIKKPTIYLDDKMIMKKGKLLV